MQETKRTETFVAEVWVTDKFADTVDDEYAIRQWDDRLERLGGYMAVGEQTVTREPGTFVNTVKLIVTGSVVRS